MLKDAGCPVGLSVYALPKTGSSFLGRFLKSLSVHLHVCMVLELKAECGTLVRVGCPPEWGGRRAAPLASCVPKSEGCSWGWLVSNTQALEKRCCTLGGGGANVLDLQPGNDTQYTECSRVRTSTLVHNKKLPGASGTLSDTLLRAGFVRGPLRQLSGRADNFLPQLKARRLVVLHARHPIEAMVSLFFCISDPAVCPIRQNVSTMPASASKGLDHFLLTDLVGEPSSHLNRLLVKYEVLASLWRESQPQMEQPRVLFSRYEVLVEHFSGWLRHLLAALPLSEEARGSLNEKLSAQYQGEFVPDGKHKHSLRAGSNLARLKPSTLIALSRNFRLSAVMQTLDYSFVAGASLADWARSPSRSDHSSPQAVPCQTTNRRPVASDLMVPILRTGRGRRHHSSSNSSGNGVSLRRKMTTPSWERFLNPLQPVFFVQIGANCGTSACGAGGRSEPIWPYQEVYNWSGVVVEPNPSSFALLRQNYAPFPNVHPVNVAISDASSNATDFWCPQKASLSILCTMRRGWARHKRFNLHFQVPTLTLAELWQAYAQNRVVDILVVDVEGVEAQVLHALPDPLPRLISYETTGFTNRQVNLDGLAALRALRERLKQAGYEAITLGDDEKAGNRDDLWKLVHPPSVEQMWASRI